MIVEYDKTVCSWTLPLSVSVDFLLYEDDSRLQNYTADTHNKTLSFHSV